MKMIILLVVLSSCIHQKDYLIYGIDDPSVDQKLLELDDNIQRARRELEPKLPLR